ncbi:MAG: type II secretion system F family protein [Phycisphaerae bacterium]|nr:type II secretion system F family protein [Phycisphaerae bacterium]
MGHYRFEVKQAGGQVASGVLAASSMAEAGEILRRQGNVILALSPSTTAKKSGGLQLSFLGAPSLKDVLNFTSQMAVMIKAGISLRAAIEGIAEQCQNPRFKDMLDSVRKDLEGGKQLSDALARFPKTFTPLYVNMVRASEMSGSFGKMLDRIVNYLAQQMETRSMVRSAMIYPAIIGIMAVVTTTFLLTYVLPKFVTIFEGKEAALPMPTKFLLATSAILVGYWWLILGVLGAAIWAFLLLIRTPNGRLWFDAVKLKTPIFRKMFRAMYISRGLHTMGVLVNSGVPMLDVIAITAQISGNALYRTMWMQVYNSVKQGKKIAVPLLKGNMLPRSVAQMIAAGEESGRLGEVLDDVSGYYSKELRAIIKNVTALIEPLMIVMMGLVVGFIAMSIVLPIFKLSSLVK